jgi:hypothetical protein
MQAIQPMDVDKRGNQEADADIDELDDGNFEEAGESGDPNVFKIRNPLVAPTANTFTTQQLHSALSPCWAWETGQLTRPTALIHEGLIDLNPPYQRGE